MNAVLAELGKKLADKWVTLLVLPGLLLVATTVLAGTLHHSHAFDLHLLVTRATAMTKAVERAGGVAVALLLVVVLLLAAAGGLLARACGAAVRGLWLGGWPWPLRRLAVTCTRQRSTRWADAADRFALTALAEVPDADAVDDAARRRNAIGVSPPRRPTWIGDRLAAVDARISQEYSLQLGMVWPRLWLILPPDARTEVRVAADSFDATARLSGWGLLYLMVGFVWWPVAPVGAAVLLYGWWRGRAAASVLADLLESVVDLHGADLARQLGLASENAPLSPTLGARIIDIVRKGA
ncbi:hypothetical protein GKC29_25375 [Micromonospora sp. WMMC415]|uniref:hypothetical protein n=1 Tax=Micromonospora sp. WMMC415 TaxID=2675222 RepID=UPI0012B4A101|nr:hypothetical protein [Micromonospora sp. WMMC415]QGN49825.1 hypothetical protein GKC29_25375 [Micromonospora sp. WMMC415]